MVIIFLFFTMYLSVFMIRYDMIFQKCMQYWLIRSFFVCDSYCDTDRPFIMVISDDPWHSLLLPSVWQWSLSFYVFYCWWWNWISNQQFLFHSWIIRAEGWTPLSTWKWGLHINYWFSEKYAQWFFLFLIHCKHIIWS